AGPDPDAADRPGLSAGPVQPAHVCAQPVRRPPAPRGDPECPAAPAASPDPGTDSQPLLVWPAALSGIAGDPARPGLPGPAPGAGRPSSEERRVGNGCRDRG